MRVINCQTFLPLNRIGILVLIPVLMILPGVHSTLAADEPEMALAGQWVAYQWDGEGTPVRLELEIQVSDDPALFSGVLRRPGVAARYFRGILTELRMEVPGRDFRIELQPGEQSPTELNLITRSGEPVSFWRE